MTLAPPPSRTAFALGAAVCAVLLGFGFYLQYGQGLEPCPLCMAQRLFYFALLAVFVAGAAHGPRRVGTAVYAALAVLLGLGGAAIAARHVWLQHLPADKVPQCGPDLYFMLENLPFAQTVRKVLQGSGECAAVDWRFLGLSIAEWSLLWFSALVVYAAWLALSSRSPRALSASSA